MRSRKEVVSILKSKKAEMADSFGVTQLGVFTPPFPGTENLHVIAAFADDRDLLDVAALSVFIREKTGHTASVISLKALRDEMTPCIMQAEPVGQVQVLAFLQEILRSIADIEFFCRGIIYEVFLSDTKTRHAVYSLLQTIGLESLSIPDEYKAAHPSVPWDLLSALPGLVSPCYGTDNRLIWNMVQRRLPGIKKDIEALPGMKSAGEGRKKRFF